MSTPIVNENNATAYCPYMRLGANAYVKVLASSHCPICAQRKTPQGVEEIARGILKNS
jgi:hypothetical protein